MKLITDQKYVYKGDLLSEVPYKETKLLFYRPGYKEIEMVYCTYLHKGYSDDRDFLKGMDLLKKEMGFNTVTSLKLYVIKRFLTYEIPLSIETIFRQIKWFFYRGINVVSILLDRGR